MTTLVWYRSRGLVSRLIRWATRHLRPVDDAGVSHVAIVVDRRWPRMVLSSTAGGVRIDAERVWCDRHGAEIVEECRVPDIADGVRAEMQRRLGQRYDYAGLLGHAVSILRGVLGLRPRNPWGRSGLVVCSELVVRCARSSHNRDALPIGLLDPETTTPEDLRRVCREAGYTERV